MAINDDTTETTTTETTTTQDTISEGMAIAPDPAAGAPSVKRVRVEVVPASSLVPHQFYFALKGRSYTICLDERSTVQAQATQGTTVIHVMGNVVLSGFAQYEEALRDNASVLIARPTFETEAEVEEFILKAAWQPMARSKWRPPRLPQGARRRRHRRRPPG